MEMKLGVAVLTATCLRGCVAACPFGGVGAIPSGHVDVRGRRLSDTYPGKIEDPLADESSALSSSDFDASQSNPTEHLQYIWNKSMDNGDAELCYWGFHTVPGPQMTQESASVSDDDVDQWNKDFQGDPTDNLGDVHAKELQGLVVQNGWVVWSGCSMGRILRRALCNNNVDVSGEDGARALDCSLDAVQNQELMFPTGTYILRIKQSEAVDFSDALANFRAGFHAGAYMHELYTRGWGGNGQIISKTVDCSQIPAKYMYQNAGTCDQMGDSKLLADEAFDVWKTLRSITKEDSTTATTGTASTTTATTNTETTTSTTKTQTVNVTHRLTFQELDHQVLIGDSQMHADFKTAVKKTFSDKFNVPEGQLEVSTSAGSVVAIVEASNMGLVQAQALKNSVENYKNELSSGDAGAEDYFVKALKEVDGIVAALPDGDLNSLSVPSVSIGASPSPTPLPTRPGGLVAAGFRQTAPSAFALVVGLGLLEETPL